MSDHIKTKCIRCGQERKLAKKWKEKINGSVVEYSQYVCPDSKCQKIVEDKLQKEQERIKNIQERSANRRRGNVKANKVPEK